ncbi:hypothetical protein Tco_0824174 [Tanacetum coccineum]|uniref:Uncharacterized protein n=1 Tax=Tanacetum coccineum TaxID=301880 RepID=A0ABQ5AJZ8_9ASTR
MASQDTRLSKFEANFKQQQGEMTNKIDIVLKAIKDRIMRTIPSDTVKNPKLNVNSTSLVLSNCSYPTEDSQCSSHSLNSINAIKTCSRQTRNLQKDQLQTVNEIGISKPREPEKALEDEFKDLHLNLPVLEVLAHAPMYNAMLDKYVESLELGNNGSAFIQGKLPKKMKDPRLFTLPCSLGDSKPFDTLADLGSYMDKDPTTVIDCRNTKIAVGEGVTRSIFRVKEIDLGEEEKDFTDYHLPDEWEIARDADLNPFKDVLVFRRMPPKRGDGAWHAKIRLINPDGDEFTKTFQSIPTTRKLSEKENPSEIIDLDHFHDS